MSATRVVVTGLGTTSPVGGDVPTTWAALLAGQSGVRPLTARLGRAAPGQDRRRRSRSSPPRCSSGSRPAAWTAPASSRWSPPWRPGRTPAWTTPPLDPERLGVAMASGIGGVQTLLQPTTTCSRRRAPAGSPRSAVPMLMPNAPAANVGLYVGAQGRRAHPGLGLRLRQRGRSRSASTMIRLGRADVVVVGGTEAAIHPLPMAAFGQMMALSKRNDDPTTRLPSVGQGPRRLRARRGRRPCWSSSPRSTPKARGAKMYAEVAGAGITADSHDIAQPDPAGRGGARAMVIALREARHRAVRHRAHQRARHLDPAGRHRRGPDDPRDPRRAPPTGSCVTSTKSMTGHLLGAAGALESMATVLALHDRVVPPTINLDDPEDPGRPRHRHQAARAARRATSPR